VRFYIDGRHTWTDRRRPFGYGRHHGRLHTTGLRDGFHRLTAVVRSRRGARDRSSVVVFVVNGASGAGAETFEPDYDSTHIAVEWPSKAGAEKAEIYRDSTLVAERPASAGRYVDSMLWFGTTYRYTIKLLDASGRQVGAYGPVDHTTQSLPSTGFPPAFPNSAIWSAPVGPAATSSLSGEFVNFISSNSDNANMTTRSYGVPVYEAESGDPQYGPLSCDFSCNINGVGKVFVPPGAAPAPGDDRHMAVISPDQHTAWEFYQPRSNTSGAWVGTRSGAAMDLSGDGVVPRPYAGPDAANFSLLAGLVRPEEIATGRINHALELGIPGIGDGKPACPATASVSTGGVIPEGVRFQLDPSLDVGSLGLPGWQQTIARALQVYGGYVRDNAGVLTVYGETSSATLGGRHYDGWALAGGGVDSSQDSQTFSSKFPWSSLRAINFTYC